MVPPLRSQHFQQNGLILSTHCCMRSQCLQRNCSTLEELKALAAQVWGLRVEPFLWIYWLGKADYNLTTGVGYIIIQFSKHKCSRFCSSCVCVSSPSVESLKNDHELFLFHLATIYTSICLRCIPMSTRSLFFCLYMVNLK